MWHLEIGTYGAAGRRPDGYVHGSGVGSTWTHTGNPARIGDSLDIAPKALRTTRVPLVVAGARAPGRDRYLTPMVG